MGFCSLATARADFGLGGAVLGLHTYSAGLQTHYAPWQRNKCGLTMNRLASAQVTSRRCVFFFSPR